MCRWEFATHMKELRKNVNFSLRSIDIRCARTSLEALKAARLQGFRAKHLQAAQGRKLAGSSMDGWVDTYYDMDYKRRNLDRMLRRCALRAQVCAENVPCSYWPPFRGPSRI